MFGFCLINSTKKVRTNPTSPLKFVSLWNSAASAVGVSAVLNALESSPNNIANIDIGTLFDNSVPDLMHLLSVSKKLRKLICIGKKKPFANYNNCYFVIKIMKYSTRSVDADDDESVFIDR